MGNSRSWKRRNLGNEGGDFVPELELAAATNTAVSTSLQNGSFEKPIIPEGRTNMQAAAAEVPYWSTTAFGSAERGPLIEIANASPDHMNTNAKARAAEGNQFSQICGDGSVYSQYQIIQTTPNSVYTWGLSHRCRDNNVLNNPDGTQDVMAVVIGPNQNFLPSQNDAGVDQLRQIALWALEQGLVTVEENTKSETIEVYSTPFSVAGSFDLKSTTEPFSSFEDEFHSEKWLITFISDDNLSWRKYSGQYYTQAAQDEMIFSLVPIKSRFANRVDLGNLVDAVFVKDINGIDHIVNGGYENVVVSGADMGGIMYPANNASPSDGAGWYSTDANSAIELDRPAANGTSQRINNKNMVRNVMEGNQFAELNADEESSLYQYVATPSGKLYEWSIYHRGRMGVDSMALVIGPKQNYDPSKQSMSSRDQLMKMVDWVTAQGGSDIGLNIGNFTEVGCSRRIVIYSAPFDEAGMFSVPDDQAFSWTEDATHTERWSIWIMSSDCNNWYSYGAVDKNANYDYSYLVPEGQNESIFAFVSVNSVGGRTIGNLIDVVTFSEHYSVTAKTTPNGQGTYIYNGSEEVFTYDVNYTGYVLENSTFDIVARPQGDAKFVGALINGAFLPVDAVDELGNPCWVLQADGSYIYQSPLVDRHYEVYLRFTLESQVNYDVNGGNPYHYDPLDDTTGSTVILGTDNANYTSHAADSNNPDWRFNGWSYVDQTQNVIFPGEHYVSWENPGNGEHAITITDTQDSAQATKQASVDASLGATLVAQWLYQQAFVTQIKQQDGTFVNSEVGGTVQVVYNGASVDAELEPYQEIGGAYWAQEGDNMSFTATAAKNYKFLGWYDEAGQVVSTNPSLIFQVFNRSSKKVIARFEPQPLAIRLTKTNSDGTPLKDAGFTLYKDNGDGVFDSQADSLVSDVYSDRTCTQLVDQAFLKTNEQGVLTFYGLDASDAGETYWLAETYAPTGYSLLAEPLRVVIKSNGTADFYHGEQVKLNQESSKDEPGTFDVRAVNMPTPTPPVTGGPGALIFSVAGVLMMLVSFLCCLKKRRS